MEQIYLKWSLESSRTLKISMVVQYNRYVRSIQFFYREILNFYVWGKEAGGSEMNWSMSIVNMGQYFHKIG